MSLSHTASTQPDLVSEFHDIFSGEGKLERKLHLEIDKSVPPVALPVRKVHSASFNQVKEILSAAPVLKFFNPKESVELQCDASDKGLGACLMQGGQPVAYASRCMTETEVNYTQIEK